jgi:hypothetical protein
MQSTMIRRGGVILGLLYACGTSDPPQNPATDSGSGDPDAGMKSDAAMDAGGSEARMPEGCPFSPPTACPDPKPTYADVQPIFEERCFACHDGNHGQWGLTDYQHVADWFGEIRSQMLACTMPPPDAGMSMPVSERMQILTWIRCGFPR